MVIGSDFHNCNQPDVPIGSGKGGHGISADIADRRVLSDM